jgi:hypothetical protein
VKAKANPLKEAHFAVVDVDKTQQDARGNIVNIESTIVVIVYKIKAF